eukprot:6193681-Pleurochrysis_carterae.AAC.2
MGRRLSAVCRTGDGGCMGICVQLVDLPSTHTPTYTKGVGMLRTVDVKCAANQRTPSSSDGESSPYAHRYSPAIGVDLRKAQACSAEVLRASDYCVVLVQPHRVRRKAQLAQALAVRRATDSLHACLRMHTRQQHASRLRF